MGVRGCPWSIRETRKGRRQDGSQDKAEGQCRLVGSSGAGMTPGSCSAQPTGADLAAMMPRPPAQLASSRRGQRCLGQHLWLWLQPVSRSCQTDQLSVSNRSPLRAFPPCCPPPFTSPTLGDRGCATNLWLASRLLPHLYNHVVLNFISSNLPVGP